MSPRRICFALLLALLLAPQGAASAPEGEPVRPAALAGSWYPDRPSVVSAELDRMTRAAAAAPRLESKPIALVVPHAGWRYSGVAAAAAYRNLKPGDFDRVVLVAPSHRGSFQGFSVPEFSAYRTPGGDVPLCRDVMESLSDGKFVRPVSGVHDREHSIEIELPFLLERLDRFCLVPILAGRTDAATQKSLAKKLAGLHDGRTLFVFSTDFVHYGPRYGYTPFGGTATEARERIRALDRRALQHFSPPDAAGFRSYLEETSATICGRMGLGVLLELLPRIAPKATAVELSYYLSIEIPDMEAVDSVSYVALAYIDGKQAAGEPLGAPADPPAASGDTPPLDPDLGAKLLRVARATIETELNGTDDLRRALRELPSGGAARLSQLQAAFVTLERTDPQEIAARGKLRGCIGQVEPTYTLPKAVVVAAASAALADRRFQPVRAEELDGLSVELTVLSPPRPVDSWKDIELGLHGITLEKGGRRAVFLPQVPVDQGWDLEETLDHLARKAGLPKGGWREGTTFQVFEGQKFREHEAKEEDSKKGEKKKGRKG